jgi:membrane-bound inhibitor of C-type lysozyme
MLRTILVTTILALSLGTAACQRRTGEPAADAGKAGDSAPSGTTGVPAATDESAIQPAVHWECDGGLTLTTRYMPRDRAISLGLHEGERKLPQVRSASGEKYQDGPITFWAKGTNATYERVPTPAVNCRRTAG